MERKKIHQRDEETQETNTNLLNVLHSASAKEERRRGGAGIGRERERAESKLRMEGIRRGGEETVEQKID